ncbi:MAG: aldehyde dehydrogenase family protein, partial [Deferribacterota bacterium]|nr:aldehyde dehydrogenase family protein [Deferribacterota bacterium]
DRDYNVDIGVFTTENQLNKVKEHVDEALSMGAKIIAKSKVVDGKNVMPAMVLTDVNHNMQIMKDETFGLVIGVMKVSSIEKALELANDSYLGLTGSVWSKNLKKAEKIGRQIKAGAITINDHLMSHGLPETSWGGFKQSGIGRTHGFLGFYELTQPQMIVNDILPFIKKNIFWHPYDKKLYDGLKGILHFLYSHNIKNKILGVFSLLRVFPRMFKK